MLLQVVINWGFAEQTIAERHTIAVLVYRHQRQPEGLAGATLIFISCHTLWHDVSPDGPLFFCFVL